LLADLDRDRVETGVLRIRLALLGSGTTVSPDDTAHGSRFTGKINWMQLDLGTDDHHFIDPEERLRIAMARQ
jgi:hypothetical protein